MLSIDPSERIILASTSPRRKELLSTVGLVFEVEAPHFDETVLPEEHPRDLVERLAIGKARSLVGRYPTAHIIGADTVVAYGDEIFGKPVDAEDASRMLRRLQGTTHSVWSAFSVVRARDQKEIVGVHESKVQFRSLTDAEVSAYIATREPFDKAGAYAVQGVGSLFIKEIHGCYASVVGLHVSEVIQALIAFGVVHIAR